MDIKYQNDDFNEELAKKVGHKMVQDRKAAGFSTRAIAAKLGYSPTHYNRMENGQRLFHDVEKLILFCKFCHVNLEEYLVLYGLPLPQNTSMIRRVFPAIENLDQESAIISMANIITSNKLTKEELEQMISMAKVFAMCCGTQKQ